MSEEKASTRLKDIKCVYITSNGIVNNVVEK